MGLGGGDVGIGDISGGNAMGGQGGFGGLGIGNPGSYGGTTPGMGGSGGGWGDIIGNLLMSAIPGLGFVNAATGLFTGQGMLGHIMGGGMNAAGMLGAGNASGPFGGPDPNLQNKFAGMQAMQQFIPKTPVTWDQFIDGQFQQQGAPQGTPQTGYAAEFQKMLGQAGSQTGMFEPVSFKFGDAQASFTPPGQYEGLKVLANLLGIDKTIEGRKEIAQMGIDHENESEEGTWLSAIGDALGLADTAKSVFGWG